MSPRKRQQYWRRPPRRNGDGRQAQRQSDQAIEAAARQLIAAYDALELRELVRQSREACEWADQQARDRPSPEALLRYRQAARRLAEVERALVLVGS